MAATAGNQKYQFNGKDRTFGLLSVEDLMTITASIPNPSARPCVNVVLPAPKFPVRASTIDRSIKEASLAPSFLVSSALFK